MILTNRAYSEGGGYDVWANYLSWMIRNTQLRNWHIMIGRINTYYDGILFFARYAFRVQHHPERLSGCVAPVLAKHAEEEILI
ncbi:hypothetical protein IAS59_001515 [Cryptococcus gattii]